MMCEVVATVDFWLGHVIKRFVASVLSANAEVTSEILARRRDTMAQYLARVSEIT